MKKQNLFMVLVTIIILTAIVSVAQVAVAFLWLLFHSDNNFLVGGTIVLILVALIGTAAKNI